MIYKLLISLFILQGTFFAASGGNDLESQKRTASSTSSTCSDMECSGKTCAKSTGSLWLLGMAGMKAGAFYTSFLAYHATDNQSVKKALIAAMVGDGIGIGGYTFASLCNLCSGEASAYFIGVTEAFSWKLSFISRMVAVGIEDNTSGVEENLRNSSIIGSLTLIPGIGSVCCLAAGDK